MRLRLIVILSSALLFATAMHAATRAKPRLVCVGDDSIITGRICAAVAQRLKLDTWSQDPSIQTDLRVEVLQTPRNRLSARLGTRSVKGYDWGPKVTAVIMDAESLPMSAIIDLAQGIEASMSIGQEIKPKG